MDHDIILCIILMFEKFWVKSCILKIKMQWITPYNFKSNKLNNDV